MSVLFGTERFGLFVDGVQEAAYVAKVLALSPIAYWILGEHEGSVAVCQINRNQNGSYTAVTLGNAGIGDGQVCPSFDGLTGYVDIYSATLAAAFNGSEGSLAIWSKVSGAGVWTDGTTRVGVQMFVDSNNLIRIDKSSTNNQADGIYKAGGTTEQRVISTSALTFQNYGITWSATADEVKVYYAGAQVGATMTGLGAWAGSLSSTRCLIGANTQVPENAYSGYQAHCVLFDSVLTSGQMASLAAA